MSTHADFLKMLIDVLDAARIPYMLCGSLASSLHGHPRATNDVDIVIAPTEPQLYGLVESLGKDYYLSPQAAADALKNNSMFNVIDSRSGWKADFIIRKQRPFNKEEFDRRKRIKTMGIDIYVVSPEDAILTKLEWSKDRQSSIHFQDALGVAAVQWEKLDFAYLRKWAKNLDIEKALSDLLTQAEKLVHKKQEKEIE